MAFEVRSPDPALSPLTGMTRRHWVDAGKYLLEGVFRHVKSADDPIRLPKQPGKTYPQPDDPAWKFRAAEFEGLARTFMVAAPLIAEDPEIEVGGYKLRDYYSNAILRATDPSHPQFVGYITDMAREFKTPLFQHTAEGAALALGLIMARKTIWSRYSKTQKDQVARLFADYAHNKTNAHNWRFFNVMLASFLKANGYEADDTVLTDHLQGLMSAYVGDGWYRDNQQFDFYSCWAFQFYGPIWCSFYGYRKRKDFARIIEKRNKELQKTYLAMFGRNGHSLMWGRSIMYRCAASAPIAAAFLLKKPLLHGGFARRIASGNLLQFLTRDDLMVDGTPSLGFYGTFEPLVQAYSCAASPFWLAKIFLALHLPPDSPFWTETETEGDWPEIGSGQKSVTLAGPGLTITRHGSSGAAEVRPGKNNSTKGSPDYTRLVYNTAFPAEQDDPAGATASSYAVTELGANLPFMTNKNLRFGGLHKGVLYRQCEIGGWMARIDLADIIVPGGVLRVDRLVMTFAHELRLGHFALPHIEGPAQVARRVVDGRPVITARGGGRAVALVALRSWDGLDGIVHEGVNPEARQSTVIYARRVRTTDHSGLDLAITLMLHRTDGGDWSDDELSPIARMEYLPFAPSGQPCGMKLRLKDQREFTIDFQPMMANVAI